MPTPLRNRFVHLDFEIDAQEWWEWAIGASIRPEVIAFIRFRPQLLSAFDRDANAFPSPRSWEFVASSTAALIANIENELFAGTVGVAAATELSGFLRMFRELPNIDAILLNPTGELVPDSPAAQYAVATALAQRASDANFDRICLYLDRMPTEFRVLSVRDATLRDPRIKYTAGYTKWAIPEPPRPGIALHHEDLFVKGTETNMSSITIPEPTLSSRAMLCSLWISQWSASKHDRQASEEIATHHGAQPNVGRYNKLLIPKETLAELRRIASEAGREHNFVTLPWDDSGYRVLPAAVYMEHMEKLREYSRQFMAAVEAFAAQFDQLVIESRSRLGGLFWPEDHPTSEEIRTSSA